MRRVRRILAVALAVLFVMPAAHADAPANDNLADAIAVTGEIQGSNEEATLEPDEPDAPSCIADQGLVGRTLWYSVAPDRDGEFALDSSGSITIVATLYSGTSYADLVEVGCGSRGSLRAPVVAGTTYLLQIGGFNSDPGSFTFTTQVTDAVDGGPPPVRLSDALADAPLVSSFPVSVGFDPSTVTVEPEEDSLCDRRSFDSPSGTSWLRIVAPVSGVIPLSNHVDYPEINVYRGDTYGDLETVSCDSSFGRDHLSVQAGVTYSLQMFVSQPYGDDPIEIGLGPVSVPPSNDALDAAKTILSLPYADDVDMWAATVDDADPQALCDQIPPPVDYTQIRSSVWYRFVSDTPQTVQVDIRDSDFFWPAVDVFIRGQGRFIDQPCVLSRSVFDGSTFTALPGVEYFIRIAGGSWDSTGQWLGLGTMRLRMQSAI